MSLNNKTFSDNLVRIRKIKGISSKELASLTGISQRMITYYEKHTLNPPIEKIEIIAKALSVNASELLGTNEKQTKTDMNDFDVRTIKKLRKLLIFNPYDRLIIYKMIDLIANKDEYKDKLKELQDNDLI